ADRATEERPRRTVQVPRPWFGPAPPRCRDSYPGRSASRSLIPLAEDVLDRPTPGNPLESLEHLLTKCHEIECQLDRLGFRPGAQDLLRPIDLLLREPQILAHHAAPGHLYLLSTVQTILPSVQPTGQAECRRARLRSPRAPLPPPGRDRPPRHDRLAPHSPQAILEVDRDADVVGDDAHSGGRPAAARASRVRGAAVTSSDAPVVASAVRTG